MSEIKNDSIIEKRINTNEIQKENQIRLYVIRGICMNTLQDYRYIVQYFQMIDI
jgi:hypothetical protein